jgi:hypothetical protein
MEDPVPYVLKEPDIEILPPERDDYDAGNMHLCACCGRPARMDEDCCGIR